MNELGSDSPVIPIIMNWGTSSFDASTYILFEASGDSEAGSVDLAVADASEDDAMSCSDGSPPDCAEVNLEADPADGGRFGFNCEDYGNVGGCYGRQQDDRGENRGGDCDEEDGVVDQCCGGREAPPEDLVVEAKDDVEDSRDERESDRLFWESCLQS